MHENTILAYPAWRRRFPAALCYLGLFPFLWRPARRGAAGFLRHHYNQAAAIFALLLVLLLLFALVVSILSYLMVYQRTLYDATHPEGTLLTLLRRLLLCWLVVWVYGLGLALWGSTQPLPLLGWLAKRPVIVGMVSVAMAGVIALLACALPFGFCAVHGLRSGAVPGRAYVLYEDVGTFPRWLFAMGYYPITRAAHERWGAGSALLLPVSRANIERALAEGAFVFIGSHGLAPGLLLDGAWLPPEDVAAMPKHPDLQFVYLTSCDSGAQRTAWEAAFAPAQVITYERLTPVIEHLWWVWRRGPGQIRALE